MSKYELKITSMVWFAVTCFYVLVALYMDMTDTVTSVLIGICVIIAVLFGIAATLVEDKEYE